MMKPKKSNPLSLGGVFISRALRVIWGIVLLVMPVALFAQDLSQIEYQAQKADEFYPSRLDSAAYYANEAWFSIQNLGLNTPLHEEMADLLGLIYRRQGKTNESETFFLRAIELSKKKGNQQQLADSYNRIGLLYRGTGRYDEAIGYYRQSISLKRAFGDMRGVAGSFNNLGNAYRAHGSSDSAYASYQTSIDIRETLGDERYLSSALLNMGNWLAGEADYQNALVYYERFKEIKTASEDTIGLSMVINNIGNLYFDWGQYDNALSNYLASLELALISSPEDGKLLASKYLNIGVVYEKQEYFEEAIQYFREAFRVYTQFDDPQGKGEVFQNLGKVFDEISEPDSALKYYNRALEMVEGTNNSGRRANILSNLGVLFNQKKEYRQARDYLLEAGTLYEELEDHRKLAEVYNNLGATYFYLGNAIQSENYYLRSLQYADESEYLEIQRSASFGLAELYADVNDFENAYNFQLLYDAYKDSLVNLARIKAIEELITEYETEKIEAQNQVLRAQNAEDQAVIERRNAENRALIISVFSLLGTVIGIIAWFQYRSRKKRIISAQKETLYQNQIDSLLDKQRLESISAMMEGQDKERKRLAAELHDRLGSILSLVKLYFSSLNEDIKEKQPELLPSFTEGNQFLDDAFKEVRALIKEMKEGTSSGEGLTRDLETLLSKITKLGIEINSRIELDRKLDNLVEMNVYRIIQEALSNSLKYSRAELIELELDLDEENQLNVMIKDNGVGFDTSIIEAESIRQDSYGLENMENRVKLLGGKFNLEAELGKGVTIDIHIPVIQKEGIWSSLTLN
ncbi:MAG: tetratricopeptide repeat-containing sensor histidine kinase [Balneola sp.]|nr:MAG: tetratricopeptide repeat-containing sensor histidine kinase [Balneola sp.]